MVGKYEVVTLCGSTKFNDTFIKAQEALMFEHKECEKSNECEHEWEFVGASYTDFDTIHHYECSKCGAKKSTSIGI